MTRFILHLADLTQFINMGDAAGYDDNKSSNSVLSFNYSNNGGLKATSSQAVLRNYKQSKSPVTKQPTPTKTPNKSSKSRSPDLF